MIAPLLVAAIVGYFLGALPFGFLISRAKGINIFEHGSKNPGATNVRRVLGKAPGNLVFFLDALKGAVAAGWPLVLSRNAPFEGSRYSVLAGIPILDREHVLLSAVIGLVAAVLGHSYSCFTRFRGGKGVATTAGGFLVLMPVGIIIGALVWTTIFYCWRYVSLASLLAAASLPVSALLLGQPALLLGLAIAIALFVALRHRANIVRLFNGTENKFLRKPPAASSPEL